MAYDDDNDIVDNAVETAWPNFDFLSSVIRLILSRSGMADIMPQMFFGVDR